MAEPRSTIRSRELGDALRHAMEHSNLSGKRAAALLGWSETKVSRLLTGQLSVREVDVSAVLALCLITGDERERLLALARDLDTPGWLQQYGSSLPEQLRTLINHETRATKITEFEPCFLPGLLQTVDYARALIECIATAPPDQLESRVEARISRQSLISSSRRPQLTFYLHELMFRLPVGGPAVMSDQMHHLLRMSVRSNIIIRVIPASIGAYAGIAGACRLMESHEFGPVVYVEEETTGLFLEEAAEIAAYRKVFTALANCALSQAESKDVIAALAIELYADRKDL